MIESCVKIWFFLKALLDKNSRFLRLNRNMNHSIRWTVIYSAESLCCTVLSVDIKSVLHITDQPNQTHGGGVGNKNLKKKKGENEVKKNKIRKVKMIKSIQKGVWGVGGWPGVQKVLIGQLHFECVEVEKPRGVMTDEPGGPMAGRQEEGEPIRRPAGQDCS